jgi:hypothetical protein
MRRRATEASAGQEKLMLRLKVPPSLQLEMRSLGESKTQCVCRAVCCVRCAVACVMSSVCGV